ncbi:MAG: hypothetical protein JXB09_02395, partial [Deltaproteobacteria bacterium]|nr:hypothetical protein [Deltaproteobacteria bacterium]
MRSIEERRQIVAAYKEFDGLNYPQVLEKRAAQYPDKELFIHGDERITYREFNDAVDHLAAA